MKTCSHSSNTIQQILRLKKYDPRIGPLQFSHEKDAIFLQRIARDISDDILSTRDLLFTTGLGLSHHKEIPLRLPSLLIPALHILKQCKENNIEPPTYLIYQATEFIAETNCIPITHAKDLALRMQHYLRRYIEVLHPDLAHHVRLELGCGYPDHVRLAVERIAENIRTSSVDLLHQLSECEQRHSRGSGQAAIYAGANVLYNGAIPEEYLFSLITNRMPYFL